MAWSTWGRKPQNVDPNKSGFPAYQKSSVLRYRSDSASAKWKTANLREDRSRCQKQTLGKAGVGKCIFRHLTIVPLIACPTEHSCILLNEPSSILTTFFNPIAFHFFAVLLSFLSLIVFPEFCIFPKFFIYLSWVVLCFLGVATSNVYREEI